jgi:hypothetical protein
MLPRARLLVVIIVLAACRRGNDAKLDDVKLDDVSKMAYEVKPSVVRINAYATAEFRYDAGRVAVPSLGEGSSRAGGRSFPPAPAASAAASSSIPTAGS